MRASGYYADLTNPEYSKPFWSLSESEQVTPDNLPGSNAAIIIDRTNYVEDTGGYIANARGDFYNDASYYSITATVNTELNMVGSLTLAENFSITSSSDTAYSSSNDSIKQLRLVAQTENFLNVGGDMTLSTDKYFTSRISLFQASTMRVGGALQFNYTGDAEGYHAFDMSDMNASSTGASFTLNLGGLASSGRAVYMTSAHSVAANFIFSDNNAGDFKGGNFEGVFATDSSVSSTLTFTMNDSGRQSVTIYSAANAAAHGIASIGGRNDMTIGEVSVSSGELIFNSEVAINTVTLDGGSLKLTASAGVRDFIINAGSLIYGGTIRADSFTVAAVDEIKIVFSAEDLASHELVLVEYGYLGESFAPNSIFVAYDESGNKLGGEFSLTGEIGGSGSLIYTVPEPAAVAAAIGALALAAAFARRGK